MCYPQGVANRILGVEKSGNQPGHPALGAPLVREDALRWLGRARFQRYLDAAGNDGRTAVALYAWNAAVAAMALTEVWHLEVALRNAYHRELSAEYPDWVRSGSALWLRRSGDQRRRDAQTDANDRTLDYLADAGGDTPISVDNVIARTSLGMWCNITDQHREPTLWTNMLSRADPPPAGPRSRAR
jgi:hypothetical protein